MTRRKPKLHNIERPFPVIPYRLHEHITFRLCPTRTGPLQTFTGNITCLPEQSPLGCYHVETKDDTWFILESEIIEKIGEAA